MTKDILKFAGILATVLLIAAGALGYVDSLTRPRILAQQEQERVAGIYAVLPGSENGVVVPIKPREGLIGYAGYANPDTTALIGHALEIRSKGYSSEIRILVGIDPLGTIRSVRILSQQETPGLGTRIEEIRPGESAPWFTAQFQGKDARKVRLEKDGGEIQSITGATISSRAVTDGIRQAVERFYAVEETTSATGGYDVAY